MLPFLTRLPPGFRPHFVAACGELVGTWLFLFFAFAGTQVANTTLKGEVTQTSISGTMLYIALSFGFSLAVNAWVFFRISGGLFNPAVTLGMCLVGAISWVRGMTLFIAQMIGAILAALAVSGIFPENLMVETTLNANTSSTQGLFIEMFLSTELLFTIFMLAAEKHKATFLAPVGIGLALFVTELGGVYFTGGSMNPARSFAPALVLWSFPGYHWIYWIGPLLGTLLASAFYKLIKMLDYETANPGQDHECRTLAAPDLEKASGLENQHSLFPIRTTNYRTEEAQLESGTTTSSPERRPGAPRARDLLQDSATASSAGSSTTTPSGEIMHLALETQPIDLPKECRVMGFESNSQKMVSNQQVKGKRNQRKERHDRRAHMWTEGHHVNTDGHHTWV